jgi:small subunit ribosomal protein S19e
MTMAEEMKAEKLIGIVAKKLKVMPEFKPPEWSGYVKTGVHNERPPESPDWWWTRAAAILRKISISGELGVVKLRKIYGGRKNRGHKPEHKYKASGSVMRKILQQLESAGFVTKSKNKGRALTAKGGSLLNDAAKEMKGKSK